MRKSQAKPDKFLALLARELLGFYDDFSAHNACTAFVVDALARAATKGNGAGSGSADGAMFCAQWLSDRTIELQQRLKKIQHKAHNAARRR